MRFFFSFYSVFKNDYGKQLTVEHSKAISLYINIQMKQIYNSNRFENKIDMLINTFE